MSYIISHCRKIVFVCVSSLLLCLSFMVTVLYKTNKACDWMQTTLTRFTKPRPLVGFHALILHLRVLGFLYPVVSTDLPFNYFIHVAG